MKHTIPAIAVGLLAGSLLAQQNIVYHSDPSATTGRRNAFPFGSEGVRIQQLIPGSVFGGPVVIQDLFAASPLDIFGIYKESEVVYADFEIRMGPTGQTLTTNWQTNNPNATTVYRGPLRVRFLRGRWVPLGLPRSYSWNPSSPNDNLCVEFIHWKVANTGSIPPDPNGYFLSVWVSSSLNIQRAFLRGWTTGQPPTAQAVDGGGVKLGFLLNDGNFVAHGGGCVGSSGLAPRIEIAAGTWPQLGNPMTVELRDGPLSTSAFLSFGVDNITLGPIPLPLDLVSVGAPGCFIWHDNLASLPAIPTDPTGAASQVVPIPANPALSGLRLFCTWINLDLPANGLGITTSGYATVILGT